MESSLTFRNRIPAFPWGFMTVFMTFVIAMTGVLALQGPPPGTPAWLVTAMMSFFWLGGLGGCAYAFSQPVITVTIHPDATVTITRRYPLFSRSRKLRKEQLRPVQIVQSEDSEGGAYFRAMLTLPDDSGVALREGHGRNDVAAAAERFNSRLWPTP